MSRSVSESALSTATTSSSASRSLAGRRTAADPADPARRDTSPRHTRTRRTPHPPSSSTRLGTGRAATERERSMSQALASTGRGAMGVSVHLRQMCSRTAVDAPRSRCRAGLGASHRAGLVATLTAQSQPRRDRAGALRLRLAAVKSRDVVSGMSRYARRTRWLSRRSGETLVTWTARTGHAVTDSRNEPPEPERPLRS
jgi:hypothetical protein